LKGSINSNWVKADLIDPFDKIIFVSFYPHDLIFQDVKELMGKNDLVWMELKMGSQLRIRKAIQTLRNDNQKPYDFMRNC